MLNLIETYQKELNKVTEGLTKNEDIVACFVIGSMVNGDIWQGSDIDLIIIDKNTERNGEEVYATSGEVPIQGKFIAYNEFFSDNRKLAVKLKNSKTLFCKDESILNQYSKLRYMFDEEASVSRLIYLGNIIKDKSICEKYLNNGGICTSYEIVIRILQDVSKLYLNLNQYIVSKDSINMASTFNDEFSDIINKLFNSKLAEGVIKETLSFIENFINENLYEASIYIINLLKDQDRFFSSYEIKKYDEFQNYNINFEHILKELVKFGILEIDFREYKGLKENVYKYKGVKNEYL